MSKDTNPPPAVAKEAPLPIDVLKRQVARLDTIVGELEDELEKFRLREAAHWHITEDFLAKFGSYYNIEGSYAGMFILHSLLNTGAYGIALSPQQGLIEDLVLPIRTKQEPREACMIPIVIPNKTEVLEAFDAEPVKVGANT